jgi:hypothetical protein
MKHRYFLLTTVCLVLLVVLAWESEAKAQTQLQADWTSPFPISTSGRKASEAYLASDQYGYAHIFWTEELDDERIILQYVRYDGRTWPTPIDIRVTAPFKKIGNVSPTVDKNGILHVTWTEGDVGPAFYTSAPAYGAVSVQNWQKPRVLHVPANRIKLQVDSKGVLHILYVKFLGTETGVYYIRSEDEGANWTAPVWLDPDIPLGYGPRALTFIVDESDGLHASWYNVPQADLGGDWVRYAHSLDGGDTWSQPFTIDKVDEENEANDEKLSAAGPIMAVQGQNVHVLWAGGKLHYRHHRLSTDRGVTWSEDRRIFGELNGQAFEGLAVDGDGRLHYFGQIRFPMGIYHAVWDGKAWTTPSLIYLIRDESDEVPGTQIEAHYTYPIIRAGNQIVLTFTEPPSEPHLRLFVMEHKLEDVDPAVAVAIPTSSPLPTPDASPTPLPTEVPNIPSFERMPAPVEAPAAGAPLWIGMVAALLLFFVTVAVKLLKLRH